MSPEVVILATIREKKKSTFGTKDYTDVSTQQTIFFS